MSNEWPPQDDNNPYVKETYYDEPISETEVSETSPLQDAAFALGQLIAILLCIVVALAAAAAVVLVFIYTIVIFVYGLGLLLSLVF